MSREFQTGRGRDTDRSKIAAARYIARARAAA